MRLPLRGQPLHTRSLTLVLTQRPDGLLRAAGEVIDLRKAGMVPMVEELQTAGIIHHMRIDLLIQPESRRIERIDVEQPAVAVEASEITYNQSCRDPSPRLQELTGRTVDAALPAAVLDFFGGPKGCSHLLSLFHLMAKVLPHVLDREEAMLRGSGARRRAGEKLFKRSVCVDGFESDDDVVQLAISLMDYQSRPVAGVVDRLGYLLWQREVRALAQVALAGVRLVGVEVHERERTRETLLAAPWVDRTQTVGDLVGRPIMPGLGRELRARLGGRVEDEGVLDALAQIAPGFVQCTPALTDRMLAAVSARQQAAASGAPADSGAPALPAYMAVGGATDSCYMWRRDGPLLAIRPLGRDGAK